MNARVLVSALVALSVLHAAAAYRYGDVVPMEKRGQFNFGVSEWTNMVSAQCPHFLSERAVELKGLDPKEYHAERGFKLSFRVDGGRFITPYVTVNDGKGTTLNFITFRFTYRGDDIVDVDWEVDYEVGSNHGANTNEVKRITLHYTWEEYEEEDTAVGMALILLPSFFVSMALVLIALAQVEMLQDPMKSLDSLGGPSMRGAASTPSTPSADAFMAASASPSEALLARSFPESPLPSAPHTPSPHTPAFHTPAPHTPASYGAPETAPGVISSPFAHSYAHAGGDAPLDISGGDGVNFEAQEHTAREVQEYTMPSTPPSTASSAASNTPHNRAKKE